MKRILIATLITSFFSIANAQFVILDPSQAPKVAQNTSNAPGVVNTQSNASKANLPVSDTIRAPYLKDTLRKIVPTGWNAFVDRNINVTMPVEYMPASDWKESLRNLANRYNLVFKIDNDAKKVFVDAGPGGMRDLNADNRNIQTSASVQIKEKPMVTQMPDGRLRLEVKDKQLLSDALRQFLNAGGWDLRWEAGSDIRLEKGLVSAGTDIKAIMDDILPNFRMHAVIHRGNNTVVVLSNNTVNE